MTRIFLLFAFALAVTSFMNAQTLVFPGDGSLQSAIHDASDGDVLELIAGGEYTLTNDSTYATLIDMNLTIQVEGGTADTKPIIKLGMDPSTTTNIFFKLGNNSGLVLRGLIFDGEYAANSYADNLIKFYLDDVPASTFVNRIKMYDCEIKNLSSHVIHGMNSGMKGYIITDSTVIDNCVNHNTGTVVMYKYTAGNYLSITNSTIYDISSYGIRIGGYTYTTLTNSVEGYVDHTTWNNIGITDNREILLLEKGPNEKPWTVTNSIFANQVSRKGKTVINLKETTGDSLATITNIVLWEIDKTSWRSHTVKDTITADPQFADAANGDFTIAAGNVCLTWGTDGGPVGDPRWATNAVSVRELNDGIPSEFSLDQNYPNPFNPTTTINFSLSKSTKVKLTIYDAVGQVVKTLLNNEMSAGSYSYEFDASNLSSGIYFYKLQASDFSSVRKMVLTK